MRPLTSQRLEQEGQRRESIRDEIERHLRGSTFQYINLADAEVLTTVAVGWNGWACVIGHPDFASYEWVVRHDTLEVPQPGEPVYEHSNQGWGTSTGALRAALEKLEV